MRKVDQYIVLSDGRKMGYAEYGQKQGKPILLFHGIPGSRFFNHPDFNIIDESNVRLIVPDRPGIGLSDFQPDRKILDWAVDTEELVDYLNLDQFSVAGYSGGGPYALACDSTLSSRISRVGLISSVAPTTIPGLLDGMLLSNRMGYLVGRWMPWILWQMVFRIYFREFSRKPEKLASMGADEPVSDHWIFGMEGVRQVLLNNFKEAFNQGTIGTARDAWLLSRNWGIDFSRILLPVFLWQGESDVVVTPSMGRYLAKQIPGCQSRFLPGEGHLIFFKYWKEIVQTLICDL